MLLLTPHPVLLGAEPTSPSLSFESLASSRGSISSADDDLRLTLNAFAQEFSEEVEGGGFWFGEAARDGASIFERGEFVFT